MAIRSGVLLAIVVATAAQEPEPLIRGIDHTPVVVADLEKAQADFQALGFAIKPGRPHADGIRNAHVKFPDGTEIELITAPQGVDALTAEYRAKLESGEGPVYFGVYAPDQAALAARLQAIGMAGQKDGGALGFPPQDSLHALFFGQRNKSPTDKPEHFAHPNGALRLSGLWVRDRAQERVLLAKLGVKLRPQRPCGPIHGGVTVAELPEGELLLVQPQSGTGEVIGARVEVRSLAALKDMLEKNNLGPDLHAACDPASVWLPPSRAHGIWLQFVQAR